jgi:phosphotransferase system enzyme I (PtsP)
MLLDLDTKKAAAMLKPLIERPAKGVAIRERIEAFAAAEGLQL